MRTVVIQTMKPRSRERSVYFFPSIIVHYSCALAGTCCRYPYYLSPFFVEEASSQKVVQVEGDKRAPLHPLPSGYQCHYHCQWYYTDTVEDMGCMVLYRVVIITGSSGGENEKCSHT